MLRCYKNGKLVHEDPDVRPQDYHYKGRDSGEFVQGIQLAPGETLVDRGKRKNGCHKGPWLARVDVWTETEEEQQIRVLKSEIKSLEDCIRDADEFTGPGAEAPPEEMKARYREQIAVYRAKLKELQGSP